MSRNAQFGFFGTLQVLPGDICHSDGGTSPTDSSRRPTDSQSEARPFIIAL